MVCSLAYCSDCLSRLKLYAAPGLCCPSICGVNPPLPTIILMERDGAGRIILAAGMMDDFTHVRSALAGMVTALSAMQSVGILCLSSGMRCRPAR